MAWDTIDSMRDLLRSSLGRSLRTLDPIDRLLAAWPVACGPALAAHGTLLTFTDGTLTIRAEDPAWHRQLLSMHGQLLADLRRIAAVDLREIHFEGGARAHRPPGTATRQPPPPPKPRPARLSRRGKGPDPAP